MAYAFYTRPRGGSMVSIEERWSRSDTVDVAYIRHSGDYGRTWTAPVEMRTGEPRPGGMLRRHPRCGFVEPDGRYVEFWNEGILPSDGPLEGLRQWNVCYRVSRDGGRSFNPPRLQPGDDPALSLSNFFAREDRRTGEIAIHMTRLFAGAGPWAGDAYLYGVAV